MLSPLHDQFELGFGIVGESFHSTAEELEANKEPTADFHRHLPISFLYRHAIELFLKSAIIIFHRRFEIPYGTEPAEGAPYIPINGKWKSMYNVHSVSDLFNYLEKLFAAHKEILAANTRTDWSIPSAVPGWINLIESFDRSSTFFRYPVTADASKDSSKSGLREITPEEFSAQTAAGTVKKGLNLMVVDANDIVTKIFQPTDANPEILTALRELSSILSTMHIGLRMELCEGC